MIVNLDVSWAIIVVLALNGAMVATFIVTVHTAFFARFKIAIVIVTFSKLFVFHRCFKTVNFAHWMEVVAKDFW